MPHYLIRSEKHPSWCVWLADCDHAHAAAALDSLEADPACPNNLVLEQRPHLYDAPPRKKFWQFWR